MIKHFMHATRYLSAWHCVRNDSLTAVANPPHASHHTTPCEDGRAPSYALLDGTVVKHAESGYYDHEL